MKKEEKGKQKEFYRYFLKIIWEWAKSLSEKGYNYTTLKKYLFLMEFV